MKPDRLLAQVLMSIFLPAPTSIAPCFAEEPLFSDIKIEKTFGKYLEANQLLMEVTGVKIIHKKDGGTVVLAVASTALSDDSPAERLRAEKVCRVKALASMVAEEKGVFVCHTETLQDKTKIIIDDKGEKARSVSEFLQITKTKVEGITKDMPVVGRWKSKDGDVFYLALGVILDGDGNVVQVDKEKASRSK